MRDRRRRLNVDLPQDLCDRLDTASIRSGVPRSRLVERAIDAYLNHAQTSAESKQDGRLHSERARTARN